MGLDLFDGLVVALVLALMLVGLRAGRKPPGDGQKEAGGGVMGRDFSEAAFLIPVGAVLVWLAWRMTRRPDAPERPGAGGRVLGRVFGWTLFLFGGLLTTAIVCFGPDWRRAIGWPALVALAGAAFLALVEYEERNVK